MKLNEIISRGKLISLVLLDLLKDPISIPKDNPYNTIAALLLIMETITKLGWVEHSSDWDIGCVITLNNGSVIETEQGWGDSLKLYDTEGNEIYPESYTPFNGLPRYYDPSKTKGFTLLTKRTNIDNMKFADGTNLVLDQYPINIWDIATIQFYS